MRTAERFLDGLTLVALGFVFLGSTLGYLPWSTGTTLLALISLWPILLVTAGLEIIGRGLNSPWLKLVSSGIALAAVLYGGLVLPATQTEVGFFGFGVTGVGSSQPFSETAPTGSVEEATLVLKGGAGEIDVDAGQRDVLVSVSGETPFDDPTLNVARSGDSADVTATFGSGPVVWPLSGRSRMDLRLSPEVTWDVQFETGAASLKADLRDVPVEALRLKTGASSSDITLGRVPFGIDEAPIGIESGVAAVTIRIPSSAAARIESQSGLSSISVPSDFERLSGAGRTYESGNYSGATRRYLIRVQTGLGSVDIKRY